MGFQTFALPICALTHFIHLNGGVAEDVTELRHDVDALAIASARKGLPVQTRPFIFTIARNHLINRAKRAKIVSFELVADLETIDHEADMLTAERHAIARDTLRRAQEGLDRLSPRVKQIVLIRKVEGLNPRETAEHLGIGIDEEIGRDACRKQWCRKGR